MEKPDKIKFLITGGLIAAVYTATTYALFPISYGAIQFRISEALTVLAAITPAAIPGLTLGCILSNLGSPLGIVDILVGALATLAAASCTYFTRQIKIKGFPLLCPVFQTVINAVAVGAEMTVVLSKEAAFTGFITYAFSVGIGEFAVCTVLGIPLYFAFNKYKHLIL